MNSLIVLSALVAVACAAPGFYGAGYYGGSPSVYNGYPYAAPLAYAAPLKLESQYHAQDVLGQYSYGYDGGLSAKSESRFLDGSVAGGYSYVDAKGEVQNVKYTADAVNGFRVAASNLPVAPAPLKVEAVKPIEDTVEVAEAKAKFFSTFEEAKNRKIEMPIVLRESIVEAPKAVEDTVEVAKAKADFLTTYEEVKNRKIAAPIISYAAPAYTQYAAPAYTQYAAPAYTQWAAPAYRQYVAPEIKTYAAPAYTQYTAPAYTQYAAPAYTQYAAPIVSAPIVSAPITSQYHAQDELGQYSYGYNGGLSAKAETKSFDGVTRGGYSYVDANNQVQNVQYTADAVNGFRVAASNLPVAPVAAPFVQLKTVADTAEVEAAKADHFAAHVEAKGRLVKA